MLALDPYLNFAGRSEEALNFYEQVFGSDAPSVMRYADSPDNQASEPPMDPNLVMHGSVQVWGSTLIASNAPASNGIVVGNAQVDGQCRTNEMGHTG